MAPSATPKEVRQTDGTLLDAVGRGQAVLGYILIATGAWLMIRGLWGGHGGKRGLLRGHQPALERAEGWRVVVVASVVGTRGFAALTDSALLFYMAIGIGFVELWEANFVIAAWRAGTARTTRCA